MDRGVSNENYKRLGGIIEVLRRGWMILGWMVVSWCVVYLHDEYSWLGWLNRKERKWSVIVRDVEWNERIWIRREGMSIDCYVWSAGREWLVEDKEKGAVEYWIWLECIEGYQWRGMELSGWGLKRIGDEGVFASNSVDEERTKRCFCDWNWMMELLECYRTRSFLPSTWTGGELRTSFFTWEEWMEEWRELDWLLWRKSAISLLWSMGWRMVSGETLNPHE